MKSLLQPLLLQLKECPEMVSFNDVISAIDENYDYSPSRFKNGNTINEAGENAGSCKIFAFAKKQGLDETQTLSCFGDYYRKDVLLNPDLNDHLNIRNFMKQGWSGIHFEGEALTLK